MNDKEFIEKKKENGMKAKQFTNTKGNKVNNHFVVYHDDGTVDFQSYDSIIVRKKDGKIYLGKDWDYSKTTGKYRNQFLGETKDETQRKLDQGIYILDPTL